MYFDGHTRTNHVIGHGLRFLFSALDDADRWSWNGHYVALGDQYELVVVNLESGASTRLVDTAATEPVGGGCHAVCHASTLPRDLPLGN